MVRIILTVDNDGKIRGLMVKCMVIFMVRFIVRFRVDRLWWKKSFWVRIV